MKMEVKRLKAWRKALNMSQKEAAEALGLKRRIFQYYEKGERDGEAVKVPKTVRLACWALTQGVTDYAGPEIPAKAEKVEKVDKADKAASAKKADKQDKPAAVEVAVAVPLKSDDSSTEKSVKPVAKSAAKPATPTRRSRARVAKTTTPST